MQTRKEFILNITRIASVALLSSTTAYLLLRQDSDEKCNFNFICNNCKKLNKCNIDKAVELKNSKAQTIDNTRNK